MVKAVLLVIPRREQKAKITKGAICRHPTSPATTTPGMQDMGILHSRPRMATSPDRSARRCRSPVMNCTNCLGFQSGESLQAWSFSRQRQFPEGAMCWRQIAPLRRRYLFFIFSLINYLIYINNLINYLINYLISRNVRNTSEAFGTLRKISEILRKGSSRYRVMYREATMRAPQKGMPRHPPPRRRLPNRPFISRWMLQSLMAWPRCAHPSIQPRLPSCGSRPGCRPV